MITISEAGAEDFPVIQKIAYETWLVAYGNILSKIQLDYMLRKFYSDEMLTKNLRQKRHLFLLAGDANGTFGFASYEHQYEQQPVTRLHKLYVQPAAQRKGAGKALLDEVEIRAIENRADTVSLNVNRFNPACEFYVRNGYQKIAEIDISIGEGFLMQDFMMEKKL